MNGQALIGVDGCSLEIQCSEGRLWMTLRRIDGMVDLQLMSLVRQEITGREIESFLPHWRNLSWTPIPDSDLSRGQWMAQEGDWRLCIYGEPGSRLWHAEVMDLYERFMETKLL